MAQVHCSAYPLTCVAPAEAARPSPSCGDQGLLSCTRPREAPSQCHRGNGHWRVVGREGGQSTCVRTFVHATIQLVLNTTLEANMQSYKTHKGLTRSQLCMSGYMLQLMHKDSTVCTCMYTYTIHTYVRTSMEHFIKQLHQSVSLIYCNWHTKYLHQSWMVSHNVIQ